MTGLDSWVLVFVGPWQCVGYQHIQHGAMHVSTPLSTSGHVDSWQLTAEDGTKRNIFTASTVDMTVSVLCGGSAVVGGNNITTQLTRHLKIRVKPYLMYHHPELSWSLLVPVKLCKRQDLGYRWVGHILAQLFSVWLHSLNSVISTLLDHTSADSNSLGTRPSPFRIV